jgi:hypothetical protein
MAQVHFLPRGAVLHDGPEKRKRDVRWGRAATHHLRPARHHAFPGATAAHKTRWAQQPVRLVRLVSGDAPAVVLYRLLARRIEEAVFIPIYKAGVNSYG